MPFTINSYIIITYYLQYIPKLCELSFYSKNKIMLATLHFVTVLLFFIFVARVSNKRFYDSNYSMKNKV